MNSESGTFDEGYDFALEKNLTFKRLQEEHKEWREKNFPDSTDHQPLLGCVEELSELIDMIFPIAIAQKLGVIAHSQLKGEQNIRFTQEEHDEKIKDAVGDLLIFLTDYCTRRGYDLQDLIETVWSEVKDRDWIADPMHGGN